MPKTKTARKKRAASALKPKHVSIEAGQRLVVHVTKGGKPVAEYISGATDDGTVTTYLAPEAAPPVVTPGSISGT
jgi:hypothetical protein